MALFKILRGNREALDEQELHDGYAYFTPDTGEFFIDYLNNYIFPSQKSVFVENLGWTALGKKLPIEYQGYPYFNFQSIPFSKSVHLHIFQ